jgi:hypothetical protein
MGFRNFYEFRLFEIEMFTHHVFLNRYLIVFVRLSGCS